MKAFFLLVAALAASLPAAGARADAVEDFYRGKVVSLYCGTGDNSTGAVSLYARAIAQVARKYIPGNPTTVLRFMPGAGGITAANFVYSIGPQDGTVWGFISRGFVIAPLLGMQHAEFDPTKYNWIGSTASEVSVAALWAAGTDARTIQEAMARELVVGATAPSQDTGLFPLVLNRVIGTRFKIVSGYKSSGEVDLAMQRGEVQGKVGWTWGTLNSGPTASWIAERKVQVILQMGLVKSPRIPAEVPLALDLARSVEDRQLLELIFAPAATGYPSFMGPGVPPDRVAAIRKALMQALADPELVEVLRREKLDIDPIDGSEVASIVKQIYSLPPSVVARARDLIPPL